jgi:hypothetical protein
MRRRKACLDVVQDTQDIVKVATDEQLEIADAAHDSVSLDDLIDRLVVIEGHTLARFPAADQLGQRMRECRAWAGAPSL